MEPLAATVNETELPGGTVWLTGCVVMAGGVLTVSVAVADVTFPLLLVATTV